jgi:hypothetical protein
MSELAEEMLLDFLNAVETGIATAKQRYKEQKGLNDDAAWDPNRIKWERTQGSSGLYERSEDINNLDFKLLLKNLAQNCGKLFRDGYFYWAFQNRSIVGRKKRT